MSVVGPKGPQAEKVPLCRSPTGPWGGVVSRRPSFTRPLRLSPSIATYPSRRRSEEEGTEPLRAPPRRLVDSLSHIMVGQVVRILELRPFPTPPPSPTIPSTGTEKGRGEKARCLIRLDAAHPPKASNHGAASHLQVGLFPAASPSSPLAADVTSAVPRRLGRVQDLVAPLSSGHRGPRHDQTCSVGPILSAAGGASSRNMQSCCCSALGPRHPHPHPQFHTPLPGLGDLYQGWSRSGDNGEHYK